MTEESVISVEKANLRCISTELPRREKIVSVVNIERISDGHRLDQWFCENGPPTIAELEEQFDNWILTKAGNNEPSPVYCTSCRILLVAAMDHDTQYQFKDALWLEFQGGYGMAIDPPGLDGYHNPKAILCKDCIAQLCSENTWIDKIVNPTERY